MPLSKQDLRVIAQEALDWVQEVAGNQSLTATIADDLTALEAGIAADAAKVIVADKARALLKAVADAIATGVIQKEWARGSLPQALISTGLKRYDPRIAFQAGVRSAYSAGRYKRGMDDPDTPFWLYRTRRDERVRNSHQALNGVALPKTDKFWDDHFPPNGWRCRCLTYAIDREGLDNLKQRGLPIQETAPKEAEVEYLNKATGEREKLPASIEPGWNFNPAKGAEQMRQLLTNRMRLLVEAEPDSP